MSSRKCRPLCRGLSLLDTIQYECIQNLSMKENTFLYGNKLILLKHAIQIEAPQICFE